MKVSEKVDIETWVMFLHPQICALDTGSAVGLMVLDFLRRVEDVLAVPEIETTTRAALIIAAVKQCETWYFG